MDIDVTEDEDIIILNIENVEFKCDRRKLIRNSPYFEVMFNGNFTEKNKKQITLQDVKINGLKNILKLIDKKIDFIPYEDIYDTLEDACMLQFDFVKQHCVEKLQTNINNANCLRIWQICERLDIHPLAEKAKCKALINFKEVRDTESIYLLNIKELHSYLADTLLNCDNETDVIETGVKWWLEKNNELRNCDDNEFNETKYLLVLLRCLDYTVMSQTDINNIFLLCPDINNNNFTRKVLSSLAELIGGNQISDTVESRTAVEFFHNCRKRRMSYLPCVVCHEFNESFNKKKRQKYTNCKCVNTINVYFYDKKSESMKKLIDLCMHNEERCNAVLEGYQIIPYKQNLLFFGGEYKYGTADWNKSVWVFDTFSENWKLLTKLPKERRHFKSIVIQDKLYILGGTGKYRIIQDNMMVYDIKNDTWDTCISLPQTLYNLKCFNYNNKLFVISGNFANKFVFLYTDSKIWQRIDIEDPTLLLPKDIGDFIIFCLDGYLYFRGSHLIQLELIGTKLTVINCSTQSTVSGMPDALGFCQDYNRLHLFSHYTCESDSNNIYLLEQYNPEINKSQTLLQINDSVDITWNINSGCFSFFHYSIVKDSKSVLDFVF